MQAQDIKDYCMSKLGAYEYDYKITLKCTADAGQFYRMAYPEKVVR